MMQKSTRRIKANEKQKQNGQNIEVMMVVMVAIITTIIALSMILFRVCDGQVRYMRVVRMMT